MTPVGSSPNPPAGPPGRPRRADARRNYELLLTAARELFDVRGVDVPLDDIARRAGIGNATMYRHFPTRQDLIVAVYADEVTALCARGEALLEDDSPGDALFTWLGAFVEHAAAKRDLALALSGGARRSALFETWHSLMHDTVAALLSRAQHSGAVRTDVDGSDLLTLANGIALTGPSPARAERLLGIVRTGTDPRP
jgi:AcrR family transcriptional regulator